VGASIYNENNPLFKKLNDEAGAGNKQSQSLLQGIAADALMERLEGIPSAKVAVKGAVGLYGGSFEGSVQLRVTGEESDRAAIIAGLAQFAETFKQEEFHVRQATDAPVGTVFDDGSYVTPVHTFKLKRAMPRAQIERLVSQSGLTGVTIKGKDVSTYWTIPKYKGDLTYEQWSAAVKKLHNAFAGVGSEASVGTARTWLYGQNSKAGRIAYESVRGDVHWSPKRESRAATRIAARLKGGALCCSRG
jgi:hypothetical protein